jgi:hypothetical protein
MHQVSGKFMPRLLAEDKKIQCDSICEDLLQQMNDKDTFQKYVHGFMGITVITKEKF